MSEEKSRINNSILNTLYGIISYLIILVVTFISRRIFNDSLGSEFLGLNSFFSNIISMLSLTEMGLSTAIIFFLYEPVANKNYSRIKSLMEFYKKFYFSVGVFITGLGLIFTLFISFFVTSTLHLNEIRFYFILYLFSTTVTYFYAYKKSILYADQNNRVISVYHTFSKVLFEIIQMIIVVLTKQYFLYLILLIIFNFLENYLCSRYVDKKYSWLKITQCETIEKKEKYNFLKKVKYLLIQNISNYIVSSTDVLIISKFINTINLGMYSNYILITTTLRTLFSQIFSSFTTSFGNLYATEDNKKCYEIFKNAQFMAFWIISFSSITFYLLIQNFIELWMGKDFLFSNAIPFLITASFYMYCINVPSISVQNALGLHDADKNIMIIQAIFNIIFSLIGVQYMGISGVILGTVISTAFLPNISKPLIIYKNIFKKSSKEYFYNYIFGIILTLSTGFLMSVFLSYINISNLFLLFVIKGISCFIFINLIYYLIFKNKSELAYFKNIIFNKFNKRRV